MEYDKNKLNELSNQIKAKLIEAGKQRFILRVASTNSDLSDIDYETINQIVELSLNYDAYYETRLVDYDCGGYDRVLILDGVVIENDILYFYLTEVAMSSDGDDDKHTEKVDLDGLLDERSWWMAGGSPLYEFCPDQVLEYYVNLLSDDDVINEIDNI